MKHILHTVWIQEPFTFIMPLMYFFVIGFLVYNLLKIGQFNTMNEILGFAIASLFFFLIMAIAPIFGSYSKYGKDGEG